RAAERSCHSSSSDEFQQEVQRHGGVVVRKQRAGATSQSGVSARALPIKQANSFGFTGRMILFSWCLGVDLATLMASFIQLTQPGQRVPTRKRVPRAPEERNPMKQPMPAKNRGLIRVEGLPPRREVSAPRGVRTDMKIRYYYRMKPQRVYPL